MNEARATIQEMRNQQLTRAMRVVAIVGFFAVLSSLSRIFVIGWHNVMYLHIALYLVILGSVIWRRHLSYSIRAWIILVFMFLLGAFGLISWGLASCCLLALFCFCIFATIHLGSRAGIIASIISVAIVGIVGACILSGILTPRVNVQVYLNSAPAWLTAIVSLIMCASTVVVALGTLNRQLEGLAEALERQNLDLLQKNLRLEKDIEERTRSEEERKLLEEKLQLARKMELIGKLAGGVAHDLNNTLGSIVGYPDLLLEELPLESPLRDDIVVIKKAGIKAAAIVNDLLTLARSGINATEIIDLNSIVLEYCSGSEFRQLKSLHRGIEVDLRIEKEPLAVHGSFFHLSKVVMNLVSNAAEAMPDGGHLLISTERRHIDCQTSVNEQIDEGEYAVLCVADTGIGISQEDLQRIFEPFYSKKTMGRSGTGLGMAVVWNSVRDHKGHITVKSVEGTGTKFGVYLPMVSNPLTSTKPQPTPEAYLGQGESILVVDDVQEQREMAIKILSKIGYSVHAVGSGEKAIAYLRENSVDLLIVDMLMEPGMDGLETYQQALQIRPGQKAIIATGFSDASRVQEAHALGAGDCLKKPYLWSELGQAVRTELDRSASY
jgi:signal transduction histidine kinase/CheY-like chemotaxis protein